VCEMQYGPNETAGRPASGGQQDAPDCVSDANTRIMILMGGFLL
jgi:hypothetical protein